MKDKSKHLPAVTVASIAATFSTEINFHLGMHLDQKEMALHVNVRESDALIRRRSHMDLSRMAFDAAVTIWQLAKKSGIADMLDIDPTLISIIKSTMLEGSSKAA